ncbi:MAG: TolC family protein [Gemmatimonadaceae bacterium]|nr:TolC family protein [Gemmatimonadaceae bacterium]
MRRLPAALTFLLAAVPAAGQPGPSPTPLDALVAEGLAANPALRARTLAVGRDEAAIAEARGRFLPSVTAAARASALYGATPNLGALINPAYAALNQLLGQSAFPTNINLTLPQKQEATLRLAQPLFEPRVLEDRIARSLRDATAADRDAQRRQLAADIRTSYLQYARAARAAALYDATVPLLDEALRVSERLLSSGKVTPDNVLRARAERSAVVQQRDAAHQLTTAARQQLNYLAGRPIDAPLALFSDSLLGFEQRFRSVATHLDGATANPWQGREEIAQLDYAVDATEGQRRIARASFLPSVSLALDYGFQGNRIRVARSTDFAVAASSS